jgi:O-antigen ligase
MQGSGTSAVVDTSSGSAPGAASFVLVLLAISSPWPFGSTHPQVASAITLLALVTALGVTTAQVWRGPVALPSCPLWPLLSLVALSALQLLPLPPSLHAVLARGSYFLWHPPEPAVAAILSDAWRPDSIFPEATERGLGFMLGLVALSFLAAPALAERRRALRATVVVGAGGLAVALYGIAARALYGSLLYGRIAVPTVAPFGPFVSKNHFAGYVEMVTLLALGLATGFADEARRGPALLGWIESRRAGRVVLTYGATATMGLAVLVSLSRGGVVSLAVGVLAFTVLRTLVRHRPPAAGRLVGILAVLAIIALGSFTVLPPEGRDRILSLAGIRADQSGAFRLGIWRDTLQVAGSSPLVGQGLGAYEDALPRFKTVAGELRIQHAENDYLELLAEGGGLGLALALIAVGLGVTRAVAGLRRQEDRLLRGLGLGATSGIIALLVHSAFDFNLRIPSNAILFAFLAAMSMAAACPVQLRASDLRSRAGWVLALVTALGAAGVTAMSTSRGQVLRMTDASSTLRRERAEAELAAHLRCRPADAEAWLFLGWLRAIRGDGAEGMALARYGAALDPLRESLQRQAARLVVGAGLKQ